MASAVVYPHHEPLHKTVNELIGKYEENQRYVSLYHEQFNLTLSLLYGIVPQKDVQLERESVKRLLNQLLETMERRVADLEHLSESTSFESDWGVLAWSLLTVVCKLKGRNRDAEEIHLEERLNMQLVQLVNQWRNPLPFHGMSENDYQWQQFYTYLTSTLHNLHNLYSHGESPQPIQDLSIFRDTELLRCINAFKAMCSTISKNLSYNLRFSQIERVSTFSPIPRAVIDLKTEYYSKVVYCMGILCARLQVHLYEALNTGFRFWSYTSPDPVTPLIDTVVNVIEQLLADCLFCSEPLSSTILVTNNLFSFQSGCLAKGPTFQRFDIQIVSEETATGIQTDVMSCIGTSRSPSMCLSSRPFPSAALLAMKPTTGTKRNNATANAEGGNTAHKKSDVNSKESVSLGATFSEKHGTWQATYPHLLCTTRQKDSALLDARSSNQIGKRPLFYFYIKGTIFSPRGGFSHCYTLSLPFTIATRRNQDCQVQRMMSSYTATCFWLYGTSLLDGLILNWTEAGIPWERFKQLYKAHFRYNAEVSRDLSDDDFVLLEQKMTCEDCCSGPTTISSPNRLVSFKNVMCPHLRYDSAENPTCKFSIWRGILEILQLFQDAKTNAKTLWDDNYLLGFIDSERASDILQPNQSVMCMFLSYVVGGSVCVVVKPKSGDIIHLEPLDLKRLQSKSLNEYLADVAAAEEIDYLLDANLTLVPISDIINKYRIGAECSVVKEITSNVTHTGGVNTLRTMRYTPVRVAVVTCRSEDNYQSGSSTIGGMKMDTCLSSCSTPSVVHTGNGVLGGYAQSTPLTPITPTSTDIIAHNLGRGDFMSQLQELMKIHSKDAVEVAHMLNYMNYTNTTDHYPVHSLHSMPMQNMPGMSTEYNHMGMH